MNIIANATDLNVEDGVYLIKFWATWCMPCKAYEPIIDKLDSEFNDITFISVDVDQVPELAQKFKVRSLPSVILIQDGEEVDRIEGMSKITPIRSKLSALNKSKTAKVKEETVKVRES